MDEHDAPPYPSDDVIDNNKWFALTNDEDGYAVWEIGGQRPVATFPPTDSGGDEAWHVYRERTRSARFSLLLPKVLVRLVVVGGVLWLLGGTATYVAYALETSNVVRLPRVFQWIQVIDVIGYRLCIGSLAILVGWWIYARWQDR